MHIECAPCVRQYNRLRLSCAVRMEPTRSIWNRSRSISTSLENTLLVWIRGLLEEKKEHVDVLRREGEGISITATPIPSLVVRERGSAFDSMPKRIEGRDYGHFKCGSTAAR